MVFSGMAFAFVPTSTAATILILLAFLKVLQDVGFALTQTLISACLRDVAADADTEPKADLGERAPLLPPSETGLVGTAEQSETRPHDSSTSSDRGATLARIAARSASLGSFTGFLFVLGSNPILEWMGNTVFSIEALLAGTNVLLALLMGTGVYLMRGLGLGGKSGTEQPEKSMNTLRAVGRVLRPSSLRMLPNICRYLAFFMIVGDCELIISFCRWHKLIVQVLHITASLYIIYFVTTQNLSPSQAAALMPVGILSAVVWLAVLPTIQKRLHISNLAIIAVSTIIGATPVLYGSMPLWTGGHGGFRNTWELTVALVSVGLSYPSFFAYSKAAFADMLPPVSFAIITRARLT